jgi:hypothetical protein
MAAARVARIPILVLAALSLLACSPSATPDTRAYQTATMVAISATETAEAPTSTPTLTATPQATPYRYSTRTPIPSPTRTTVPTSLPTRIPPPTSLPTAVPSPTSLPTQQPTNTPVPVPPPPPPHAPSPTPVHCYINDTVVMVPGTRTLWQVTVSGQPGDVFDLTLRVTTRCPKDSWEQLFPYLQHGQSYVFTVRTDWRCEGPHIEPLGYQCGP